ncbi:Pyrimidine-specific ribonucleoside hydrolase RihB [Paenibacillus solanacearum]|uniref:Pyrimidine-specific ribonucleoside hydrolase RihB n=1 Tax=Paenibacillus solanacearum TaxID=2048548 RepID=A0A916K336_9BACL|nr:nucleoside hydrolase [Paenibacillus solanacearum]CAG7636577.1 Pyrimidine-specific ribonucleoside hydrolase RihB [Paenibacillus solanacearum]
MKVTAMTDEKRIRRLAPPEGKVRMVLDTDTFNEIDDQFAVAYALASPERLQVEALYAAPFLNALSSSPGDGMEKSYHEIVKICGLFGRLPDGFVYKGSDQFMPDAATPVQSEAVSDLIARARASSDEDPLYVVAIGAITNVASAIRLEPRIIDKIVVVWLGGHALHWPNCQEFNLRQDVHASRTVLDSGVPLMLVPCSGVASHLITTLAETNQFLKDQGPIGNYLCDTFEQCRKDHFAYSRVIWDLSAVAWLVAPASVPSSLVHSPVITSSDAVYRWSFDPGRHFIRCATAVSRDRIFGDLYREIRAMKASSSMK